MKEARNTPILFLIFNRPDTTAQVFSAIAKAKPRHLFIAADGSRSDREEEIEKCRETRDIIKRIDWECDVKTLFRDENLGCKVAVSSAITWFFEYVEAGIILEDDCLPSDTFFSFCTELLEKYVDDERVMMISGNNFQDGIRRGDASYYFSRIPHIWGWATWRRAWQLYDVKMSSFPEFLVEGSIKRVSNNVDVQNFHLSSFIATYEGRIDTWDYQWQYAIFSCGGLSICPQVNLVSNIGFGFDATHTRSFEDPCAERPINTINGISHPLVGGELPANVLADDYEYKTIFGVGGYLKRRWPLRWWKVWRKRQKSKKFIRAFLLEYCSEMNSSS